MPTLFHIQINGLLRNCFISSWTCSEPIGNVKHPLSTDLLSTSKRVTSVSVVADIMITGNIALRDKAGTSEAAHEHILVEI